MLSEMCDDVRSFYCSAKSVDCAARSVDHSALCLAS